MCLTISPEYTREWRNRLKTAGSIKVYKVYKLDLYVPNKVNYWIRTGSPEFDFYGIAQSSRWSAELTDDEKITGMVEEGIHTYVSKWKADDKKYDCDRNVFVVECTGYAEDFVAASIFGELVFHKIKIDREDFDKVVAETEKVWGHYRKLKGFNQCA